MVRAFLFEHYTSVGNDAFDWWVLGFSEWVMKLKIGNETIEEPKNYRFDLIGNQLTMINNFNPNVKAKFIEGTESKTVPNRYLNDVRRRLTQARNRRVEI